MLLDTHTDLFQAFSTRFDDRILASLGEDPQALGRLLLTAAELPNFENRLLLKLICAFFEALQTGLDDGLLAERHSGLVANLQEAYRAEIRSGHAGTQPDADLITTCQLKSSLPFTIILQAAVLAVGSLEQLAMAEVEALEDPLARLFWRVDDLADIVRDVQAGALNSLLLEALPSWRPSPNPQDQYQVLASLLDEGHIERTAEEIRGYAQALTDLLAAGPFDAQATAQLRQVILAYLRNWME